MMHGPYALQAHHFWIPIHPVTLLLMIGALITNWRNERRRPISIVLGGYFAVLVITQIYFVPNLIDIIGTPLSTVVDATLQQRAAQWEVLSLVRLAFMIDLALKFLSALTIPATSLRSATREPELARVPA